MLGTPAYMSPEQYEGRPATAASDQFSFCVALWEAVYGEHPFVERQEWELLPKHVVEGRLREPPRGRGVPGALHRVLTRGLSVRPKGRWPSMDVLLQALQRSLTRRRRLAWLSASMGVVSAAAVLTLWLAHEPDDAGRCTGADDKLAEVWGPDHRAEVRRAMLATGLPYAEDRWHEVEGRLDAYAREWSEGHRRACDEGDAAMDGRMACLERRRRELGS